MRKGLMSRRSVVCGLGALLLLVYSCASTQPLPQPRRVFEPSGVQGALREARWDIAVTGYEYLGKGLNYAKAGLEPVYLAFRNKGDIQPSVAIAEVRGIGPQGEFLPYTLSEAERLVFASETFSVTASNAARTGALGALVGAGLGTLVGAIGGGDNLWKGAVIGAGVGAVAGGVASLPGAEGDLKNVIHEELDYYAWRDGPLPPKFTKVGYLYFPGGVSIDRVRIVVRSGSEVLSYELPVIQPPKVVN